VEGLGEHQSIRNGLSSSDNVDDERRNGDGPEEDRRVSNSLDGNVLLVVGGRSDESVRLGSLDVLLGISRRKRLGVDEGVGVESKLESSGGSVGLGDADLSRGLVDVDVSVGLNNDLLLLLFDLLGDDGLLLLLGSDGRGGSGGILDGRLLGLDGGRRSGSLPLGREIGSPLPELAVPEGIEKLGSKKSESVRVGDSIGRVLVVDLHLLVLGDRRRSLGSGESLDVGLGVERSLDILLKELDVDGAESVGVEDVLPSVGSVESLDLRARPELDLVSAGTSLDVVKSESESIGDLLHESVERGVPSNDLGSSLEVGPVNDEVRVALGLDDLLLLDGG